jgi:hypothetical protein
MQRIKSFPSNMTAEDRRTYRRWTVGLFSFYLAAITVAIGVVFLNKPAGELRASSDIQMARLKSTPGSMVAASPARVVVKP